MDEGGVGFLRFLGERRRGGKSLGVIGLFWTHWHNQFGKRSKTRKDTSEFQHRRTNLDGKCTSTCEVLHLTSDAWM